MKNSKPLSIMLRHRCINKLINEETNQIKNYVKKIFGSVHNKKRAADRIHYLHLYFNDTKYLWFRT